MIGALGAAVALAGAPAWQGEGTGWGVLPAFGYNSDEGLGLGALGALYRYDGVHSPYRTAWTAFGFATTRGIHNHALEVDALAVGGSPLRLIARAEFIATRTANYCGLGAAVATCDLALAEGEGPAVAETYHRMRYILPQLRVEARWALGTAALQPSLFAVWRINDLLPGDFSERGPFPGSQYAADYPGGESGVTSVLQAGIMLDSRDFEPAPTRGVWLEASARGASPVWGSAWTHAAANVTARGYLPLGTPRLVWANRAVVDGLWGDASVVELGQSGGSQRYEWFGSLNAGRGVRLRRYVGRVKAMEQSELRGQLAEVDLFGAAFGLGLLGFTDLGWVAADWDLRETGGLVPTVGGGARVSVDQAFIIRADVGVSPAEDWAPFVYLDIRNTF